MVWSAKCLQVGYERKVIGFDLRTREALSGFDVPTENLSKYFQEQLTEPYIAETVKGKKIPAIIDRVIWPRCIKDECLKDEEDGYSNEYTNEFNLFCTHIDGRAVTNMPPYDWQEVALHSDSIVIAFDMPVCFPKLLGESISSLIPYELIFANNNWSLLGYDIVDIYTESSAIYSCCDLEPQDLETVFTKSSLELNSYGILQTESDAIIASCAFDKIVPEHSPFSPCGVWVYKR